MRQRTDQKKFWKFTDEEMETAKNTDLPDLLEHLGYHLKRSGRYYTTQEMDSLMIKEAVLQRYGRRRHHLPPDVRGQGLPGGGGIPAGFQWPGQGLPRTKPSQAAPRGG